MILAKYILREHAAPFFYALFVITFLFLVDFLIRILSSVLNKGLEWYVVAEIVILNLAWMLALSVPMAVLVAALMAFGRMSADNEITALRATGISPLRALVPVLAVGLVIAAGLTWFNDRILPEANHRAAALRSDIARKQPAALIAPRILIRDFEGYQLWMDRVNPETDVFYGVRIYQQERGQKLRYTFADSATVQYTPDGSHLLIHLRDGENHVVEPNDPDQYLRVRFREQTAAIHNVDAALTREERAYRSDREMSVSDMAKIVRDSRARLETLREEFAGLLFDDLRALAMRLSSDPASPVPPRLERVPWREQVEIPQTLLARAHRMEGGKISQIARYEARSRATRMEIAQYTVEIHKKFSIPFACLVFILVGAPLGIMARRGGVGTGVIYSLAFFVLYWAGMIRGETLADNLKMSPWLAMWGPNLLVGAGGLWLIWRMAREKYTPGRALPGRLFERLRARLRFRPAPGGSR